MSAEWPQVALGEVLTHHKVFIQINDMDRYKRCRVKLHTQGIVLRDVVTGAEIKTKKQQVCKAGEFLVAEIDAKVGGFGIVPDELNGSIVSSHYFLFGIDEEKLDMRFLDFYSQTPAFHDQVAAQGSTNYAAIRSNDVLGYSIPLPPLAEQRRIVARIEELAAKVEEARWLRKRSCEELESLNAALSDAFCKSKYPEMLLDDVVTVIDPNPSHRYPVYCEEGIPIVSTVNFMGPDGISVRNSKNVPVEFYQATLGQYEVGEGDVIFSRKGKIGYARLHPPEKLAMTHTLCVMKPARDQITSRYLLYVTRSRSFIDYLLGTMNQNTGVPTLGLNVIRNTPIRVPSLDDQHRIVAYLDDLQAKTASIRRLQAATAAELDAMLPSILDKAFQGAL